MLKKGIFFLIALMFGGAILMPAFSQEDIEVVDDVGFYTKQRPPAVFRR